jgi:hypothetical protein
MPYWHVHEGSGGVPRQFDALGFDPIGAVCGVVVFGADDGCVQTPPWQTHPAPG